MERSECAPGRSPISSTPWGNWAQAPIANSTTAVRPWSSTPMACWAASPPSAATFRVNSSAAFWLGGPPPGAHVDMNATSDTGQTLAVTALFAEGPTTIRNVGHIRHKETDRLAALAQELRKLGAEVEERADGLTTHPRTLRPATIDTYDDHRMAM